MVVGHDGRVMLRGLVGGNVYNETLRFLISKSEAKTKRLRNKHQNLILINEKWKRKVRKVAIAKRSEFLLTRAHSIISSLKKAEKQRLALNKW